MGTKFSEGDHVNFADVNEGKRNAGAYECSGPYLKHGSSSVGDKYFLEGGVVRGYYDGYVYVEYPDSYKGTTCLGFAESKLIIKNKKSMLSKLSNMMKKLLDSDTQTLVKAGFVNGDLDLTTAGQNALTTILFMSNKADMVKAAQEVIDEAEAEKKK